MCSITSVVDVPVAKQVLDLTSTRDVEGTGKSFDLVDGRSVEFVNRRVERAAQSVRINLLTEASRCYIVTGGM